MVAARTELETELVLIWEAILGKDKIGVRDNFFELGGHSLKATQLMSRIYKELDVKLDLKGIFLHPTIEGLSEIIGKMSKTAYEQIVPIPVQPYYDVSHSQKRLWVLDSWKDKVRYTISRVLTSSGVHCTNRPWNRPLRP